MENGGFVIFSAFAVLADGLYDHSVQLITPSMMSLQEMGIVLAMAVIGEFHKVLLAALGAGGLQVMPEALREFGEGRLVVTGSREVGRTVESTMPFRLALAF